MGIRYALRKATQSLCFSSIVPACGNDWTTVFMIHKRELSDSMIESGSSLFYCVPHHQQNPDRVFRSAGISLSFFPQSILGCKRIGAYFTEGSGFRRYPSIRSRRIGHTHYRPSQRPFRPISDLPCAECPPRQQRYSASHSRRFDHPHSCPSRRPFRPISNLPCVQRSP